MWENFSTSFFCQLSWFEQVTINVYLSSKNSYLYNLLLPLHCVVVSESQVPFLGNLIWIEERERQFPILTLVHMCKERAFRYIPIEYNMIIW